MLRPITVAPMFASDSSTIRELSLTSPPSRPCIARQTASGKAHSCRRMPPMPSGCSTLWAGPATKPSRDIEILKRTLDIFQNKLLRVAIQPQWRRHRFHKIKLGAFSFGQNLVRPLDQLDQNG